MTTALAVALGGCGAGSAEESPPAAATLAPDVAEPPQAGEPDDGAGPPRAGEQPDDGAEPDATTQPDPAQPATADPTPAADPAEAEPAVPTGPVRPGWLGTRVLPLRPDGFGEVQPTPPELVDRRLPTVDSLPPPPDDAFSASVAAVPDDVAARSTWDPACPVTLADLRYVTLTHWGFDDRPHTGELLVHASAADGLVEVFRRLHELRFPIEEMRVVTRSELDAPPTGDGNNTTAFVCRPVRGGTGWSQHAYGLAVDVNPFHNPYVRDDLVLPELASAYADREWQRPGMVLPGSIVTEAFADIRWGWGGTWERPRDFMHFSANGR